MDVGKGDGDPVSRSYAAGSPFTFTGRVDNIDIDAADLELPC
jgi:hypothetical protein